MFQRASSIFARPLFAGAAALLASATLLGAIPTGAQAAPEGGFYRAVLVQGQAPDMVISSDVVWHGQGRELSASEAGLRPQMVCAELAQSLGSIATFSADGVALTADKIEFCNKHAHKAK